MVALSKSTIGKKSEETNIEDLKKREKAKIPLIESGLSEKQANTIVASERPEEVLRRAAERTLALRAEESKIIADQLAKSPQETPKLPTIEEFQAEKNKPKPIQPLLGTKEGFEATRKQVEEVGVKESLKTGVKAGGLLAAGAIAVPLIAEGIVALSATSIATTTTASAVTTSKDLLAGAGKYLLTGIAVLSPGKLIKDSEKALGEATSGLNEITNAIKTGEAPLALGVEQYYLYLQTLNNLEKTFNTYKYFDYKYYLGDGKNTLTKIETARRTSQIYAQELRNAAQTQAINRAREETGLR
jgi:hypothetical protein